MFEQAFKNIDDALWKESGCTTELDYTEQTSWLLFLKYLDGLEQDKAAEALLEGEEAKKSFGAMRKHYALHGREMDFRNIQKQVALKRIKHDTPAG